MIDSSIYGLAGRGVKSIADYDAEYAQSANNKLAQQMGLMKLDETRRGIEDTNALNRLYQTAVKADGTVDRNALLTGAASGGLGSRIPGLQKGFAEQDKATADVAETKAKTGKLGLEAANLALTQHRAMLNNVNDPQGAKQWLVAAYQNPDTKAIFERMGPMDEALRRFDERVKDPATFAQWKQGASMNADELVKYTTPDANTVANNTTSTENNKRTVAAARDNAEAVRDTANATREAARTTANAQRDQATELKLGDDYRKQSANFKEVSDAHAQLTATLGNATTSPAATLAGATKFMKMIDPGSVVRESELGMALNAQGVFDKATNYINTLKHGKVLTAAQAADFKDTATRILNAAKQQQQKIDSNYTRQAREYKLRPEMIVQDLGQGQPAAAGGVMDAADAILRGGK